MIWRREFLVLIVSLTISSLILPVAAQTGNQQRFDGQHFVVFCPQSYLSCKDILDFLESHYRYFTEFFLYEIPKVSVNVIEGYYSSTGYAGRAYANDYKIEIDARSWTGSPIRATLLHELTHVWQISRYGGKSWFNEGFATLLPVVFFNVTGNTADMNLYQDIVARERSSNITDRAYVYKILQNYTSSYGSDWIKRFLEFLKADGGNLRTDTYIVAYLGAAVGKDLSDDYIKEGLAIDRQTVSRIMNRHQVPIPEFPSGFQVAMLALSASVCFLWFHRRARRRLLLL